MGNVVSSMYLGGRTAPVLPDVGSNSSYGKHFELRNAPPWGASVLVAKGLPAGAYVAGRGATLSLFAGVGTEKSTLASVVGPAERFQNVRESNGNKRVDVRGQPVRVDTLALAWPYHGGPADPALHDMGALMAWMGSYFGVITPPNVPHISIGRSFGGTALLEYVLRYDGQLRSVVAVSPYTPAWTGYVLKTLAGKGRDFNLPGWQWILHLDGMVPRDDRVPMTSERLAALTVEYGGMAVVDYWQRIRAQSQWTFPERLAARLSSLRAVDPSVDALWNQDWRSLDERALASRLAQARELREAADFAPLATDVTVLFGELDDQYPNARFPVDAPESGVRAFWQAFAVAFGVKVMGVNAGHDPLGGSNPDRESVEYMYGLIREADNAVSRA